jgi:MFS transporter, DHA2 family, multidrug resistance protein
MPRVLVMMAVTPIVGKLYGKVSARLLIGVGVLLVAYGAWSVSHVTLETTSAGITHAILIQGVGFSFLFVPLTTVALSNVPRMRLADATGLNSLLRQVGASIGLAGFATLLSRYGVHARAAVASHLAPDRPEVQVRLAQLAAGFQQRGFDPVAARAAALRALDGIVTRQAMVLAFEKVLLLTGLLFLCVLPLIFFLKARRGPGAPVHVEMEM